MSNGTLVRIEGELLEHEGSSKAKYGKINRFTVKGEDGTVYKCATFGTFDPNWVGEQVSFEATHNEEYDNYKVEGDVTVDSPEWVGSSAPKAKATTAKRGRGRPKKVAKTQTKTDEGPQLVKKPKETKGTDWAAKDRSMNAGGLMHDAAALVAPTVTAQTKLKDILKNVEAVALGLVDVKLKVEAKIKG